jgi:hypothetical protein
VIVGRIAETGCRTPRWHVVCGSCREPRIITSYPGEVLAAERETDNRCHVCDQAQRAPSQTGVRSRWHERSASQVSPIA